LMKNLPRAERAFVSRVIHERYDLHCFRRTKQGTEPIRFRAFRRRWYGGQKANFRRFDVPRNDASKILSSRLNSEML
jgi:hypothetical protein